MKDVMRITGLAMVVALAGPGLVQAENHKGGMQGHDMQGGGMHGSMQMRHSFDEIDADGDGRITAEEMTAHMQARFEGADTDGDDMLSREELVARMMAQRAERMGRRADHMIERYDTDGDGRLSVAEMQARQQGGMMKRMDLDGDGAVSRAEFDESHNRRGGRAQENKGRNADK